jgi:hypothetical protein
MFSFDFLQAFVAILLAILTVVLVTNGSTGSTEEPALTLSLKNYGQTEVLYSSSVESTGWNISNSYIDTVQSLNSYVKNPGRPINHALLEVGENNINDYRTKFIVAAEFNASDSPNVALLNAMYSSIAFHAAPISLNLVTNAVLQSKDPTKLITVSNHPLKPKQVKL